MRNRQLERPALRTYAAKHLSQDGNLWLLGVPGSGRRTFIESAVADVGGVVLYLDCLRTTDKYRFITLLAQSFLGGFGDLDEGLEWVGKNLEHQQVNINPKTRQLSLVITTQRTLELDFQKLLDLPQLIAERKQKRVVVFFNNFVHLDSWDRDQSWQQQLRHRLDDLPDANYVLGFGLGGAPENIPAQENSDFEVLPLLPLIPDLIRDWFDRHFFLTPAALEDIVEIVRGHRSTAIALSYRLPEIKVETHHIQEALTGLLDDLNSTFEMLLMQLPSIQCRVLETLALDPTAHPQSNEYTQKHSLPRGGSLQGALTALVKKDLLYGPDRIGDDQQSLAYQFCQPLLGLWIQRYLA
jgi:hypothetical protein